MEALDLFQRDSQGRTIVQVARVAEGWFQPEQAKQIEQLLHLHAEGWRTHIRPLLLSLLSHLLLPELAALIVDYLDGGGTPFPVATEEKDQQRMGEQHVAAQP